MTGPIDLKLRDTARPEARMALLTVVSLIAFFAVFSFIFKMDEAATGQGRFVVRGGNTPIQSATGGKVLSVHVRDGQQVTAGQKLVTLDPNHLMFNEQAAGETTVRLLVIRERLRAQKNRLRAMLRPRELTEGLNGALAAFADNAFREQQRELDLALDALDNDLQLNAERQARLSSQIEGATQQVALSDEQVRLLQDELDGLRRLQAEGYVSLNKVRSLERGITAQRAASAQFVSQRTDFQSQLAEARAQRGGILAEHSRLASAELQDVELQLGRSAPELGSASLARADSELVAPVPGWVMELNVVGPGQVIAPGDKVMSIVPVRETLVIEASFTPKHASELRIGQRADVRLGASGLHRGLVVSGTIEAISPDVVTTPAGEGIILATIVLPDTAWKEAAASRHFGMLRAGTPVEVLAIVRRRSLVEYLLEPLTAGAWRAFREA